MISNSIQHVLSVRNGLLLQAIYMLRVRMSDCPLLNQWAANEMNNAHFLFLWPSLFLIMQLSFENISFKHTFCFYWTDNRDMHRFICRDNAVFL